MASGQNEPFTPTYRVPKTLPPPRDPSLPSTVPTTSKDQEFGLKEEKKTCRQKCLKCLYDKETGAILGRTCKSWFCIIFYTIMYLTFLATFTLVNLYISLTILKQLVDFKNVNYKIDLLTYSERGIGLTATPVSETNLPLIWYKDGEKNDYEKYVQALDKLLATNRRKTEVSSLGPCGQSPYGYGKEPCVIVRINKLINWAGQPLQLNSTIAKTAPEEVQAWMKADKSKLWLQCSGYQSYDKEHIGRIKYYPDPPGFDASAFPLDEDKKSPLVAIQISDFTIGISLAIQCKLWYDAGPSTVEFVLYVSPEGSMAYPGDNV